MAAKTTPLGLLVHADVVHHNLPDDFKARSSDEISLSKGDHVELLERDDEFGDGWFLGKHMVNENSGLFPEGEPGTPPALLNRESSYCSFHLSSS